MNRAGIVAVLLVGVSISCAQGQRTPDLTPKELLIGRLSYFDIGPPFDYLDVIRLTEHGRSTDVERVLLSPSGGCFQPAKVEFGTGRLKESIPELLGAIDPCKISAKQMKKELNRRKKHGVFSGVNVNIQLQCSGVTRTFSSAILDGDLYDAHADTPRLTSRTMQLLQKLDSVLGTGAADKPIFDVDEKSPDAPRSSMGGFVAELEGGRFDSLFPSSADLPSAIYADSKKPVRDATVSLVKAEPNEPDTLVAPKYPPIAKAARVEGEVPFVLRTGEGCSVADVSITGGPKMLQKSVIDGVKQWRFCKVPVGTEIKGSIKFELNCPPTMQTSVSATAR